MASKEVKTVTQKETQKKGRRLKRSVRKTLGAITLAAAIAVAAIPTEGLQAAPVAGPKVKAHAFNETGVDPDLRSRVPIVDTSAPIYTTGDGRFQFAYVDSASGKPNTEANANAGSMVAVILGCNIVGQLDNNLLEIPNEVDAYKQFYTSSTAGDYVAVNKQDKFLYYQDYVPKVDSNGDPVYKKDEAGEAIKDSQGNPIQDTELVYKPCYYEDRNKWENKGETNFYYIKDGTENDESPTYLPTNNDGVARIHNAIVAFIGEQTLVAGSGTSTWQVGVPITDPAQGIFYNKSQIGTLRVGKDLMGIGNYAFYSCAGITKVELGNGIETIGNFTFANCISLEEVSIPFKSNLRLIGESAFYNCQKLKSFTAPIALRKIGDSAFAGCKGMTSIELNGQDSDGASLLNELGYDVFSDCSSLESLTFPSSLNEVVDVTLFRGCVSLKYIKTESSSFDIIDETEKYLDPNYDIAAFKQQMRATFYLSGPQTSNLHNTATANGFAYSYYDKLLDKNVYELTVRDSEGNEAVFRVDENNSLIEHEMDEKMSSVEIPAAIGPYGISKIDSLTFRNNCNIVKVVIPSSIVKIEAWAFKGCHNLEWVIFNNPSEALVIEANAFKTQDISDNIHTTSCTQKGGAESLKTNPELKFVGPISYDAAPFDYAMNPASNINNGNQTRNTYITYYSGWPANLAVRYNADTDKNELVDYPTLSDIFSFTKYTATNYPYITSEHERSIINAKDEFEKNGLSNLEGYAGDIVYEALNLVIPDGIEGIEEKEGEGLFKRKEAEDSISYPSYEKTITAEGLHEVAADAFEGHTTLVSIKLSDKTTSIGDHAFNGCKNLTNVILPATVRTLGLRPFVGCKKLKTVNFGDGPYFTCVDSIIYELGGDGNKEKLVEVLEGRVTPEVQASELAGITALYPEAFMGTDLITVDLSQSIIDIVPTDAFAETTDLTTVTLPTTIKELAKDAFRKSSIRVLRIPGDNVIFNEGAFGSENLPDGPDERAKNFANHTLNIIGWEGSMSERFANNNNLPFSTMDPEYTYKVRFYDYYGEQIGETQVVKMTESAKEPEIDQYITVDGVQKEFEKWSTNAWISVVEDLMVYAMYRDVVVSEVTYTVTFYDWDLKQYGSIQTVPKGGSAIIPQNPTREGHIFLGWVLKGGDGAYITSLSNVQRDMELIANYREAKEGENDGTGGSGSPGASGGPGGSGSPGASGSPGGSGSPGASDGSGNGNGNGTSGTFYNLTVVNGSGSGSYLVGAQPVIIANDPASGQVFDHWTVSPADVKIASTVLSASIITMPASDVTVTAHYKAGSGSNGTGGSGTGSGNNNQRPNGVLESGTNGGTTVVIDKNGLSNTGVVSATVNGSSDNFTIKITETAEANEAAMRALMAEYGDNLDNIKYFPMDISLYDSTGTRKITDTSGLSINITLPLPDSLITYAGNNMVASTAGNRLERLSARFSTIQGVSCITFTAEHFSPYVIYVNTRDLSSGLVSDDTPKTGDFIHPKWFLSIGLACLSFVLFMQKDTRKQKKVKVKVRA